ncbi:MAG: hypothetical protein MZV70_39730 [Desulfobacterales bacterium]|nr:hypothetical protein [Desulfobacterales bacterium]
MNVSLGWKIPHGIVACVYLQPSITGRQFLQQHRRVLDAGPGKRTRRLLLLFGLGLHIGGTF